MADSAVAATRADSPASLRTRVTVLRFKPRMIEWRPIEAGVVPVVIRSGPHAGPALRVDVPKPYDSGIQHTDILANGYVANYVVSAWVKGNRRAIGKLLRIQVNEAGGAELPDYVGGTAAAKVRVNGRWQHLEASGILTTPDRTTLVPIMVLEQAKAGSSWLVTDFTLTRYGRGPQLSYILLLPPKLIHDHWGWPNYLFIWFGAGAAAYIVRRLSRRPRAAPLS